MINGGVPNATLTINNAASYAFAGVLGLGSANSPTNNLNLSKTGAGTFTLTGTNTYTGYTLVTGGTLALMAASNNTASSTPIDVETGATLDVSAVTGFKLSVSQTLSGVGAIVGAVSISGVHQPGVGGKQTFANDVTFGSSGREVWQLLGSTVAGATTLGAGATSWTSTQGITVTNTNGQVTILDGTTAPPTGRRFLRLQVTQAP